MAPVSGVITIDGTYGTLVIQTTGQNAGDYSYSLDAGALPPCAGGTDTFTYTLTDTYSRTSSANLAVTLDVSCPAQSQAVDDTDSIDVTVAGSTVTSSTTATGKALANDENLISDASSITSVSDTKSPGGVAPVSGVITIDGTYGTLVIQTTGQNAGDYSYSLDAGALPPCAGGTDTFTYTLTDTYSRTSSANLAVTLDVSGPAQSQAVDDTNSIDVTVAGSTVTSSTTATGNLLANDENLISDASSITSVSDAKSPGGVAPVSGVITIDGTYGTLVIQTTGRNAGDYSYSLDAGALPPCAGGTDTFTYTLTDTYSRTSSANLAVTLDVSCPRSPRRWTTTASMSQWRARRSPRLRLRRGTCLRTTRT